MIARRKLHGRVHLLERGFLFAHHEMHSCCERVILRGRGRLLADAGQRCARGCDIPALQARRRQWKHDLQPLRFQAIGRA